MNTENKHLLKEDIIPFDSNQAIHILLIKEEVKTTKNYYYEIYAINEHKVKMVDKVRIDCDLANINYQIISNYFLLYEYSPVVNKSWDNIIQIYTFYDIKNDLAIYGTIKDALNLLNMNINDSKLRYLESLNSNNSRFRILTSNNKCKKINHSKESFNALKQRLSNISKFRFNEYLIELKMKSIGINNIKREKIINFEDYQKNNKIR